MAPDTDESLPEAQIGFAGDWHGNRWWAAHALGRLHAQFPRVRTVAHVGDFGLMPRDGTNRYLEAVDKACQTNHIDRILVTPGNHEHWGELESRFAENPGQPVQFAERVWALPRGHRFMVGGRSFLSFGGAASVDFEYRVIGQSWWPAEAPTRADVEQAISCGRAEVMVTHETINGGTPHVELALAANPLGWPLAALAYSSMSRGLVTEVWEAVKPAVLVHGHMHIADQIQLQDGRQVISLGCDEEAGNVGVLDLKTLTWSWCAEPPAHDPAGQE
jgi:Calcineurin-like phosphoesterase